MTPEDIAALVGLSAESGDRADAHRRTAYKTIFALADADAPLALHWLLFTAIPDDTRADGHARTMAPLPPLPWPRRMWAGGEVTWHAPIRDDERLVRHSIVTRADPKRGAAGDFLLTSLAHRIVGDEGIRIEERQDVVFLPAVTRPGAGAVQAVPFAPAWSEPRRFGPVDLFRYSALTLNGHRIHYDAAYARAVEHYPGLVVHGPLLASHLMQAAARHHADRRPVRFAYRAVAPVFVDEDILLVGSNDGAGARLAIVGADGGLRMTASMSFADGATA